MNTGKWPVQQRFGALALAVMLAVCLTGQAADAVTAKDPPDIITQMLAEDAVRQYDLRDAEGAPLVPRGAPEMKGRGYPDVSGVEPDYRGAIGYMSLQSSQEISRFRTFVQTPWMLPVYEPDGDEWKIAGEIQHKTPVLVTDQQIRIGKGYRYAGHLQVIRLDTGTPAWIDVTQFVTVPYWTLELEEAVNYGFCVAVYADNSGYEAVDRKDYRGSVKDGTRVLMCDPVLSLRYFSPDEENNPLLGIIFRNGEEEGSYFRAPLFFNPEDLTLVY